MDLADLDLALIFKRIDVERKKDTDIREILVIVREMLESQRQARDAPSLPSEMRAHARKHSIISS